MPIAGAVAQIEPGEAGIPRWRRQSLKEARSRSDRVAAPTPHRVTFAGDAQPGVERCAVRYDLVGLLDQPDEVIGLPLADLRAGDEVDVIGRRGVWHEVRTPRGAVGWVHRTTLETLALATSGMAGLDDAPAPGPGSGPDSDAIEPEALDRMLAKIVAERRAAVELAARSAEAAAAGGAAAHAPERPAIPAPERPARPAPGATLRRATGEAPG